MKRFLYRLIALACLFAGGLLLYFAGWIIHAEIAPAVADTGWALSGDNMILNHNWRGNQLYLLVALYLAAGAALVYGCVRCWRRPAAARGHAG